MRENELVILLVYVYIIFNINPNNTNNDYSDLALEVIALKTVIV